MQTTLFDFVRRSNDRRPTPATPTTTTPKGGEHPRTGLPRDHRAAVTASTPGQKRGSEFREGVDGVRRPSITVIGGNTSKGSRGVSKEDIIHLEGSVSSVDSDTSCLSSPSMREQLHSGGSPAKLQRRDAGASGGTSGAPSATQMTATVTCVTTDDAQASVKYTVSPSSCMKVSTSRWLADLLTDPAWKMFLAPITADGWHSGRFLQIEQFLDAEAQRGKLILPPRADIFNAFNSCPFRDLKVVLLGQDPYHNLHQAHGLCFSVLPDVPPPPSLRNMYKELEADVDGFHAPSHGYLQSWSEQGMLMLNTTLTVEAHQANSHSKASGWSAFTDAVIERLSRSHPNRLVFLLWGSHAQQKKKLIDSSRHVVIESVHPSPLSAHRGWFGCRCFSKCNEALRGMDHYPMYWQLPLRVVKR